MDPALVVFFNHTFIIFILSKFHTQLLPLKSSIRHAYLLSVLAQLPIAVLCTFLRYSHVNLYLYLVYLYIFIPCFIVAEASFLQKITVGFVAYIVVSTSELITSILFSLVNLFYPQYNLLPAELIESKNLIAQLVCIFIVNFITLIITHYLLELFKVRFNSLGSKTIIQLSVPQIVNLLLMNWLYTSKVFGSNLVLYLVIYGLVLFSSFLVLRSGLKTLAHKETKRLRQEEQMTLIKEQLSYSGKTRDLYQALRKDNHDYSNHLLTLSYLLQNRDERAANEYIKSLLNQLSKEELTNAI